RADLPLVRCAHARCLWRYFTTPSVSGVLRPRRHQGRWNGTTFLPRMKAMAPLLFESVADSCSVVPREQFGDLALPMTAGYGAEGRGQPGMGIDDVELAGLDQRGDDSPVFSSGVMSCKERVLPVERNRPDGPLDGIVVELDASINQEQGEPCPVSGDVAQGLPEGRFRGDA